MKKIILINLIIFICIKLYSQENGRIDELKFNIPQTKYFYKNDTIFIFTLYSKDLINIDSIKITNSYFTKFKRNKWINGDISSGNYRIAKFRRKCSTSLLFKVNNLDSKFDFDYECYYYYFKGYHSDGKIHIIKKYFFFTSSKYSKRNKN